MAFMRNFAFSTGQYGKEKKTALIHILYQHNRRNVKFQLILEGNNSSSIRIFPQIRDSKVRAMQWVRHIQRVSLACEY